MGAGQRFFLTLASVLATTLMSIDIMIASVALPQMQGSLSATSDQISWVLTSYVITLAVMTPVVAPVAARIGRRPVFLGAVFGFTASSVLCGLGWSLESVVVFRLLQGAFAAALVPISQAVLLDSYPPSRQGEAMAYWSTGVMVGPVVGPALGGWLTDALSWRWIFFINLPFGLLAFALIAAFMSGDRPDHARPLDTCGFMLLALTLGSLQFVVDRGEHLDWFDSALITGLVLVALGAAWMYAVHSRYTQHPFIPRELFQDRNFVACLIVTTVTSGVFMANISLFAPMLQNVLGYPAREAGLMVAPRGLGVIVGVAVANRLRRWLPDRAVIATGLSGAAAAIWWMTTFSLEVDRDHVLAVGITQGFFYGVMFVPLTTATFATLAQHLRTDGAALIQLLRQLAGGIGIATCFSRLVSRGHGYSQDLAGRVNLDADAWWSVLANQGTAATALLKAEIERQAGMLAFLDVTRWLALLLFATVPLVLLMQRGGPDTFKQKDTKPSKVDIGAG
jgi:DHA2 family multidrug resistance protein